MSKKKNGGKLTSSPVGSSQHNLFIIDDETLTDPAVRDKVFVPVIDGQPKAHGLVPRDYRLYPPEMFDPPRDLQLIDLASQDPAEVNARCDRVRELCTWESLDQNGQGYCWMYSTTAAVMFLRALSNLPHVRLSAHAGACKVKNFRDEGGWCGLSAKFHREVGCPSVAFWPEKSMSRSNDRPEVWANGALHKVIEEWVDLTRDIYDQNLTLQQVDTCSFILIPMAWDFNWWGHSVFGCGVRKVEDGSWGRQIRNSWTDEWGEKGWAILRGSKAVPNGAVALRVTGASQT